MPRGRKRKAKAVEEDNVQEDLPASEKKEAAIPAWFLNSNLDALIRKYFKKRGKKPDIPPHALKIYQELFSVYYLCQPPSRRFSLLGLYNLTFYPEPVPPQFSAMCPRQCYVNLSKENLLFKVEMRIYREYTKENRDIRKGQLCPPINEFRERSLTLAREKIPQLLERLQRKEADRRRNFRLQLLQRVPLASLPAPRCVKLRRRQQMNTEEDEPPMVQIHTVEEEEEEIRPQKKRRLDRTSPLPVRFRRMRIESEDSNSSSSTVNELIPEKRPMVLEDSRDEAPVILDDIPKRIPRRKKAKLQDDVIFVKSEKVQENRNQKDNIEARNKSSVAEPTSDSQFVLNMLTEVVLEPETVDLTDDEGENVEAVQKMLDNDNLPEISDFEDDEPGVCENTEQPAEITNSEEDVIKEAIRKMLDNNCLPEISDFEDDEPEICENSEKSAEVQTRNVSEITNSSSLTPATDSDIVSKSKKRAKPCPRSKKQFYQDIDESLPTTNESQEISPVEDFSRPLISSTPEIPPECFLIRLNRRISSIISVSDIVSLKIPKKSTDHNGNVHVPSTSRSEVNILEKAMQDANIEEEHDSVETNPVNTSETREPGSQTSQSDEDSFTLAYSPITSRSEDTEDPDSGDSTVPWKDSPSYDEADPDIEPTNEPTQDLFSTETSAMEVEPSALEPDREALPSTQLEEATDEVLNSINSTTREAVEEEVLIPKKTIDRFRNSKLILRLQIALGTENLDKGAVEELPKFEFIKIEDVTLSQQSNTTYLSQDPLSSQNMQ